MASSSSVVLLLLLTASLFWPSAVKGACIEAGSDCEACLGGREGICLYRLKNGEVGCVSEDDQDVDEEDYGVGDILLEVRNVDFCK